MNNGHTINSENENVTHVIKNTVATRLSGLWIIYNEDRAKNVQIRFTNMKEPASRLLLTIGELRKIMRKNSIKISCMRIPEKKIPANPLTEEAAFDVSSINASPARTIVER